MKKTIIWLGAIMFVCAVFAAHSFAQVQNSTFDVTAKYGVRVQEKGLCEQVGTITITPKATTGGGLNFFQAGTIITVELLAGARICNTITAPATGAFQKEFYWNGQEPGAQGTAYILRAFGPPQSDHPNGDDYFTIEILQDSQPDNEVRIGHTDDSALCFNLFNTPYNETDPNLQLVQVSYRDTRNSTYTGDTYVATVKKKDYELAACKGQEAGYILYGDKVEQQGADCVAFDNESGMGYCPMSTSYNNHASNELVAYSRIGAFDLDNNYVIELELVKTRDVNLTPEQAVTLTAKQNDGIYWSNLAVMADGFDNHPCTASTDLLGNNVGAAVPGRVVDGLYSYFTYNRQVTGAQPPNNMNCDVGTNNHASVLVTGQGALSLDPTSRYLYVNMPPINYDLDEIAQGDIAWVKFTLKKGQCSVLLTGALKLGTFGCPDIVEFTQTLLYPYFTEMAQGDFWNGISIINIGDTAGTADLTIYEQDGDVATMTTPTIASNGMYVNLLSAMVGSMTLTSTAGGGVIGNSRCYIVACANFRAEGFAMFANGDTGESLGYLPRYQRVGLCD